MAEGTFALLLDAWRARRKGAEAIEARQRQRLATLVAFARTNSRYYRYLYRDLPGKIEHPTQLPVTNKKELMAHFDEWVTDSDVTLDQVRDFTGDPNCIGDYFLGQYTLLTTSGTTGTPGIFVWDNRTMRVIAALAARMLCSWLRPIDLLRIVIRGGRMSMVMGSGGHFASAVAAARLTKRRGRRVQTLSVHHPLHELVPELNRHQPAIVTPYASTARLLASEQEAGRLHIRPVLIALSAEGLPANEYERVARAFHTKVGNSYAATECPFLSYSCAHGWLHVNSDWVILEAVDENYRPVPAEAQSHTVLITNLANRIQPILRYDIGDSVLQKAGPCPCGNPLPAIRVQGRTSELLVFMNERGERILLPPLALELDQPQDVDLIQLVQQSLTSLRVRIKLASSADVGTVWRALNATLKRILSQHGLGHVAIELADEPPEQSKGGKYRLVVPLQHANEHT